MPTPGLCRVHLTCHGQHASSGDRRRHKMYPQGLVQLLRTRMLAPSPSTEGARYETTTTKPSPDRRCDKPGSSWRLSGAVSHTLGAPGLSSSDPQAILPVPPG